MLLKAPSMTKIGYVRVSSFDQDHATQQARLKAAGCEVTRKEKASGKSRAGRDELAAILEFIRPGDELVVVKLDRLGRSTRDVLNLVHELEQKGAGLRVLEPEFCTSTDTGRILVTVLGMVAEMERRFILERQRVGIDAQHRAEQADIGRVCGDGRDHGEPLRQRKFERLDAGEALGVDGAEEEVALQPDGDGDHAEQHQQPDDPPVDPDRQPLRRLCGRQPRRGVRDHAGQPFAPGRQRGRKPILHG
jgi:DNA invertase Pin-like site-specific DNA recombinase